MLTAVIKSVVRRFGYDIVRCIDKCERPINVLDLVVRDKLTHDQRFFFVQIGANDGIRSDPLNHLIMEYHLEGILVEPLPDLFEQLRQNYASEPQLSFENCAIATSDGERIMCRISPNACVPEWAHGQATFNKDRILRVAKELGLGKEYLEEIEVPTLTLRTLFRKYRIQKVSLLQIDTEGYDYEILKMAFATQVYPEIINFEYIHLSWEDRMKSKEMLIEEGYRFMDIGRDTLAVREV